jgi:hypothetical protein
VQFTSPLLNVCCSARKLGRLVVVMEGRKSWDGEGLQWGEILFLFLGGKHSLGG